MCASSPKREEGHAEGYAEIKFDAGKRSNCGRRRLPPKGAELARSPPLATALAKSKGGPVTHLAATAEVDPKGDIERSTEARKPPFFSECHRHKQDLRRRCTDAQHSKIFAETQATLKRTLMTKWNARMPIVI